MRKNKALKLRIYEQVYRLERKIEEITRERPRGRPRKGKKRRQSG